MYKKISFPLAISVIIILSLVLIGGIFGYWYFMPEEDYEPSKTKSGNKVEKQEIEEKKEKSETEKSEEILDETADLPFAEEGVVKIDKKLLEELMTQCEDIEIRREYDLEEKAECYLQVALIANSKEICQKIENIDLKDSIDLSNFCIAVLENDVNRCKNISMAGGKTMCLSVVNKNVTSLEVAFFSGLKDKTCSYCGLLENKKYYDKEDCYEALAESFIGTGLKLLPLNEIISCCNGIENNSEKDKCFGRATKENIGIFLINEILTISQIAESLKLTQGNYTNVVCSVVGDVCVCANSKIERICEHIYAQNSNASLKIGNNGSNYCAEVKLNNGNFLCVDRNITKYESEYYSDIIYDSNPICDPDNGVYTCEKGPREKNKR